MVIEGTFVTRLAYLRHAFFDTDFSPTATAFGGGGYLDIVPGGTKLAAVHFSPCRSLLPYGQIGGGGYLGIVPGGTNILGFSLHFV